MCLGVNTDARAFCPMSNFGFQKNRYAWGLVLHGLIRYQD